MIVSSLIGLSHTGQRVSFSARVMGGGGLGRAQRHLDRLTAPVALVYGTAETHVIRATAGQRASIENALYQWKFKPYVMDGRSVEVETGLLYRFTAH
jgi:hypothetical protein